MATIRAGSHAVQAVGMIDPLDVHFPAVVAERENAILIFEWCPEQDGIGRRPRLELKVIAADEQLQEPTGFLKALGIPAEKVDGFRRGMESFVPLDELPLLHGSAPS